MFVLHAGNVLAFPNVRDFRTACLFVRDAAGVLRANRPTEIFLPLFFLSAHVRSVPPTSVVSRNVSVPRLALLAVFRKGSVGVCRRDCVFHSPGFCHWVIGQGVDFFCWIVSPSRLHRAARICHRFPRGRWPSRVLRWDLRGCAKAFVANNFRRS